MSGTTGATGASGGWSGMTGATADYKRTPLSRVAENLLQGAQSKIVSAAASPQIYPDLDLALLSTNFNVAQNLWFDIVAEAFLAPLVSNVNQTYATIEPADDLPNVAALADNEELVSLRLEEINATSLAQALRYYAAQSELVTFTPSDAEFGADNVNNVAFNPYAPYVILELSGANNIFALDGAPVIGDNSITFTYSHDDYNSLAVTYTFFEDHIAVSFAEIVDDEAAAWDDANIVNF